LPHDPQALAIKLKVMTVDDRLQNLTNSERAVLIVEAVSPLSPLMVAGVVDIEHKLQRRKGFRVKALDHPGGGGLLP
jgi:hypothetical protein